MADQSGGGRSGRGSERAHSSFSGSTPTTNPSNGIDVQCQFCPGQVFRRSSLRSTDIQGLLLMQYPVRCLRCAQRQKVSFTVASVAVPSHVKQGRRRRGTTEKFGSLPPAGVPLQDDKVAAKGVDEDQDNGPPGEL